jgi:competence protein ComEC
MWFILFYLSSILLFITWAQLAFRKWLIFSILILANVYVWTQLGSAERYLKVTFFDVGQGDSALFEFPNGRTMLIDAGDRTDYVDYGERVIYPYLVRNGINTINDVLVTHAHSDHNGGVLFLLQKKCVGRLIKTHAQHEVELDSLIEVTAQQKNVPIRYIRAGDTLFCHPDMLVMALHPTPAFVRRSESNIADLNNASIVLKCVYFDHSILMTGDAETAAEKSMLIYGELLQCHILKCAHHGSSTSNSSDFRQAVSARYGIVSVAQFNRFGLPSTDLIKEFQAEGTTIFRTDAGAVQFIISPSKIIKLKKLLL